MKDNARQFKEDEIARSKTFDAKNDFVAFITLLKQTTVPEMSDNTDVDGAGKCWVDFKNQT
jgi:hypothetical protein